MTAIALYVVHRLCYPVDVIESRQEEEEEEELDYCSEYLYEY